MVTGIVIRITPSRASSTGTVSRRATTISFLQQRLAFIRTVSVVHGSELYRTFPHVKIQSQLPFSCIYENVLP